MTIPVCNGCVNTVYTKILKKHTVTVIVPPAGCFPVMARRGLLQVGQYGSYSRALLMHSLQNRWPHTVLIGDLNLSKQMGHSGVYTMGTVYVNGTDMCIPSLSAELAVSTLLPLFSQPLPLPVPYEMW